MKICMIITAAGMSTRQKRNKLLIRSNDETIIEKTINNFLKNNLNIFIVVGHQKELMIPILENRFGNDINIVENKEYYSGLASSLKAGLAAAGDSYDYFGFCNGDKPYIKIKTIESLLNYLDENKPIVLMPLYQEQSGHPIFFSKKLIDEFELISGDMGGREIIKNHPDVLTYLPVNDVGVILDMDKYLQNE